MKDRFGRPTKGLRISVTNDCDLDCFYCHREGCLDGDREMTPNEIGNIVKVGIGFGIEKVKLTGGEPLVRPDILDIVSIVNQDSINDVSMTTNGTALTPKAVKLKEAGLDRINISLDTLDPKKYKKITGHDKLEQVLNGIEAAIDAGLYPVKLNMLVMKDINVNEIDQLIEYSLDKGAILQLIELEKILVENEGAYERYHKNLDSIEERIKKRASGVKTRWLMQARRKYLLDGGEVEIVNPMHNSEFCNHCTRLRMTPDGFLKPCIMRNDNLVDILTPIRDNNKEKAEKAFKEAIKRREPYFKVHSK